MIKFNSVCEQINEKEYRASTRCSYSFLKNLSDKGPQAILEPQIGIASKGLTLGTIVDKKLENGFYSASDDYIICDIDLDTAGNTHPSKIINYLIANNILLNDDEDGNNKLLKICSELGFSRNPKFDEAFWKQVEIAKYRINGNSVISSSELNLADTMYESLMYNKYTKKVFNIDNNSEALVQAAIFFTLDDVECKSLLDRINVNHKDKTIQPYDFKTGAEKNFMNNFWNFKYYYQASLYSIGLSKIIQGTEFSDYKILPFKFIHISREDPYNPLIYSISKNFIDMAYYGWKSNSGYRYKGLKELLDDYLWYTMNGCNELRSIFENNGVINIEDPVEVNE